MFKNRNIGILVFTLFTGFSCFAQNVISDKKNVQITTGKIEISVIYPIMHTSDNEASNIKYPVTNDQYIEVVVDVKKGASEKKVKINEEIATLYSNGYYYKKVKLTTGENIIRILAEDNFGNRTIDSIKVISTFQQEIELNNGKYYAFIIGIDTYDDQMLVDLRNPVKDAYKLKELLVKKYTFEDENILLLENAEKNNIIKALEKYAGLIKEHDNLLMFFAGHGVWDEDREIGYWLPSNANALYTDNWLRNSTIIDYLRSIKSQHTLIITDACFSGSIFRTRSVSGSGISAYNKLYKHKSRKGMTSGTLQYVPDNSVFIEYLLKRLEQNDEKYLPASNLFNNVRDGVLNNSSNIPQYGVIQGVGDEGGEFIFIKR